MQITNFWLGISWLMLYVGADWSEKAQDETLANLNNETLDNVQIPQGNLALNWVG